MQKLNITQRERTLLIRLSLAIVIVILMGIASIALAVSLAHNPTITAPSQQQVQALPSLTNQVDQTSNSAITATDPYANYTPDQVVATYITAYQAADWNTCQALMAPMVLAGWTTPNQLQAQAEQVKREQGELTVTTHGEMAGSNTGTQIKYVINYHRKLGAGTPGMHGISNRIGDAPTDTPPPTSATPKDDITFITVKLVGTSWKIDEYTVF